MNRELLEQIGQLNYNQLAKVPRKKKLTFKIKRHLVNSREKGMCKD